ncbi:chitin synthase-domain-containing protein [Kalaharituber pfeilii]|nr:chitin synthase-domain-containing protein [Kalaharituber pfeilii]
MSDEIPSISDPWKASEIAYTAIMGAVMCAALLEWFLWLAAFLYCLVKVFQKAEHWTIRFLAVIMMILFTAFRCIFLPIMVVTLPLPARITQHFPVAMVSFLQWFAFWSFAGLLTIPWLFCVYQLVTHSLGRNRRIKTVLDESTAPKVVIVMPCYKEVPEVLMTAIDSIVDGDYPPSCLHIFLSFDGADEDELYLKTIEFLGVPLSLESYPMSLDVVYRGMRITVSRFPHGGKRHCQKKTFKLIDKIYEAYLKRNDNLFILFIDSDCILDKYCIQNFVWEMELKPGSKKNMLAMTGVITSTAKHQTLITLLQDIEYIHGQLFERSVESACGSVTCLPGALTILRFSAFRKMAKYYFADKAEQCDDLFDYGKCHLGEDRWLTHLFMIGAKERYQIQMCTGAFCKTEAVLNYRSLLKQRRRWFLGFITNEVCMLTDIRLWKRYPILCVVRFMQNTIRTTALLFFIMVLSLITTTQKISQLPVGFIAVSLGLNWALMFYFGLKLKRYKALLYPLMFVLNPFFNWVYMVYGIFTAGQRTWGGPRADAGAADQNKTVQEVIEQAEARGEDLEVIPETFKPAAEARDQGLTHRKPTGVSLQPGDHIDGRFAAPELLPDGFYNHYNDSMGTLPDHLPRNPNAPHIPLHPRASFDSVQSGFTTSAGNSVYMPRRVESIMGDEDRRKYLVAQSNQREAGGAYMEEPRDYGQVYGYKTGMESTDSVNSTGSYYAYPNGARESYSMHNYSVGKDVSVASSSAHSPEPPAGDPPAEPEIAKLQLPEPAHPAAERGPSGRTRPGVVGRSPLGRNSLVRTATTEAANDPEADTTNEADQDGGRNEGDANTDKKRRNKLTKHRS